MSHLQILLPEKQKENAVSVLLDQLKLRTEGKVRKIVPAKALYFLIKVYVRVCSDKLKCYKQKTKLIRIFKFLVLHSNRLRFPSQFKNHSISKFNKRINSYERRNRAYIMLTAPHIRPEHPFKVIKPSALSSWASRSCFTPDSVRPST